MKRRTVVSLLVILSLGFACDILYDCENERKTHFEVGFYQVREGIVSDSVVDSVNVYGVTRPDSLILNAARNVQSMVLPLNPGSDTAVFVIILDETKTELSVYYERKPEFISDECGLAMKYRILNAGYQNEASDSLEITEETVDELETEHIRIYL